MLKKLILKYAPEFVLDWAKALKKKQRRIQLEKQEKSNVGHTLESLAIDLRRIGLQPNDSVLVHSSLSKIGFVAGGSQTVIEALFDVIGSQGTLLFPSFPALGRNKTHLQDYPVFDLKNTESRMGSMTEYFRKLDGVLRSFHPTDSVCAKGPLAEYFTNSHFGQLTPYNEYSPFRKLCNKNGKILMLGTTLNGACTNLHTLEDAVDFIYPVYDEKIVDVKMIDMNGLVSQMKTKVHNPDYSSKRNCDALKPMFEREGALVNGYVGEANCMLIDADKLLEVMVRNYNEKGVTMYTPFGNK